MHFTHASQPGTDCLEKNKVTNKPEQILKAPVMIYASLFHSNFDLNILVLRYLACNRIAWSFVRIKMETFA